jgi:hypothetical protein
MAVKRKGTGFEVETPLGKIFLQVRTERLARKHARKLMRP